MQPESQHVLAFRDSRGSLHEEPMDAVSSQTAHDERPWTAGAPGRNGKPGLGRQPCRGCPARRSPHGADRGRLVQGPSAPGRHVPGLRVRGLLRRLGLLLREGEEVAVELEPGHNA